jgi:peptidoglycan hydrolase CwlO-like protein
MSGKPVARHGSPITLGIICILLVVSVLGTYFFQSSIIDNTNATYDSYVASHTKDNAAFDTLQSQYSSLQSQYATLQESLETYISTHGYNDSDYNFLKSTLNSLQSTYNSLQTTYNTYVANHNHADSEYSSMTSQLTNANSQIITLQTWLNGNITALVNANNQITSLQNQINSLNIQIGNLQTSLNDNLTALVNANFQINTLNNQINNLNTLVSNLTAIATLQKSTIWLNNQAINVPAHQPFAVTYNFEANYAGYFAITAQTLSSTSINYRVLINGQNLSYSNGLFGVAAGTSFTMYFPLTQLGNVQITLGSITNAIDGIITITYYY